MAKNDDPPKPKGECPGGSTHQWVRDGHDMKCVNCNARYTVD